MNHPRKLAGGDGDVHIRDTRCILIVPPNLEFFGGTGHNSDHHDVFRVEAQLLRIPGFGGCAEHLHRGFTGREVRELVREIMLAEFDPAGRTGGDHRQDAALGDPLDKLVRLLHNRHIGGEVGVEHLIEPEPPQRRSQLAGHIGADRHPERLAEGRADRRRGLYDDIFGRVRDRVPNLLGMVVLGERTGRADDDALPAGNAGGVPQPHTKRRADMGREPALVGADHADPLPFGTGGDTAAAEHAFAVVTVHMHCRMVDRIDRILPKEPVLVLDPVIGAELLKLARAGTHAGEAAFIVGGEDQLEGRPAGVDHPLGVGNNLHPLGDRVDTGGYQGFRPFHLDHTDPAGADFVDLLEIAEGGDLDAGRPRSLKDGVIFRHGQGHTVEFDIHKFHFWHAPFLFLDDRAIFRCRRRT